MRRTRKIILWILAIIIGLPVIAIAAVLIFANTGAGQRLIEQQATSLTGGLVALSGLSGRFPDDLHVAHLEVRDQKGAYVTADNVVLDWSPTALLGLTAKINLLSAGHLSVPRLPVPSTTPSKSSGGFSLPVAVDVTRLDIARADIGAPVAGAAASLKLTGTAHVTTLQNGSATIDAARLDSQGVYHVQASLTPASITADITAQEPQGGLIASIAKLPALGPLAIDVKIAGPQSAERAHIAATAGKLRLNLDGTVDIPGKTAAIDLTATAPAMQPAPAISWQGINISAHSTGPFLAPEATAQVTINGLAANGAAIQSIAASLKGTRGAVALHAVLTGTHLPGAQANLFASAPIDLTGNIDLQAPRRPAQFQLSHPLLNLSGEAQTAGGLTANVTLNVPDIAPIAATAGSDVKGKLGVIAHVAQTAGVTTITANGKADLTGGQAPIPTLLGPTEFTAEASMQGQDITVKTVTLNGRQIHLDLSGTDITRTLDVNWTLSLPDLAAVSPQARGAITAKGHVSGPLDAIAVTAAITGEAGSVQFAKAPVSVTLNADHVPSAPNADITAKLQFQGAPFTLLAQTRTTPDGTLHTTLQRADWKSLAAKADLSLPKSADVPTGTFNISIGQLNDFSKLAGTDLAGSLKAVLNSAPDNATVEVQGSNLANGTRRIAALSLKGRAQGDIKDPDLTANLNLDGISAQGVTGQSRITLHGKQTALNIGATALLQNLQDANANLSLAALLNAKSRQVTLNSLTGNWKTLALRQQGPALIDFGQKIAVDHLHLTVNQATLAVAGQVSPTLNVTAALHNVTPDLAKPVMPSLAASGTLTADAHLTGTPAAPQGNVHLTAQNLRMKSGPGASLPPAQISAAINLNGKTAGVNAHLSAGPKLNLAVTGTAPLQPTGALNLQTTGHFDLTLTAPILEAGGRRASGQAAIDMTATGTPQAPRVNGSITLTNAEIQDYAQGANLSQINARIDATGDTITITRFHATAGQGNIELAGTIGAFAPGLPVDLHLTAHNARPLASDLLTATLNADLTVKGQAQGILDASGKVLLQKVEINIPDSLPTSVATLNVHRPGEKPPAPPPPGAAAPPPAFVRLDIIVDAPSNIFVRGKGLDAEMGGKLTITGTSAAPQIAGGFDMRNGTFSLAGANLTFTKGSIGFNGSSSAGKIDPTLNFVADNYANGYDAQLHITGYADNPKITLTSTPDLPQDEILAHLLFGTSMTNLSPFQIAEIGAALAELSGATGSGGPLGSLRKGLGLDRLSVGGGSGSGPTVEAGKYVAKGVYVGAKQATGGGGGTQALVQIDITRHLKLNTTLGTGGGSAQGATPQNDPGSSVGLSYGFEY
jgi:translocation and assembly module TamB